MIERAVLVGFLALSSASAAPPGENLLENGGFERGMAGWSELWARTPSGAAALDESVPHGGRRSVRIEHTGTRDWSLQTERPFTVRPGQIYEWTGWVRLEGEGTATLCATLRDSRGEAIDWVFGGRTTAATKSWRRLRSRFVIPTGAATIQPRLIGERPAKVWFDDASFVLAGSVEELRTEALPVQLEASTPSLRVRLLPASAALEVTDRRSGRKWVQRSVRGLAVLGARAAERGFELRLLDSANALELRAAIRLDENRPELTVELMAIGELSRPIRYPASFSTAAGMHLVMPVNEGIAYPVDDETLPRMWYHLYGGHGLCMAWYGLVDGEQGILTIVETPDDAAVGVERRDGFLCLEPEWKEQRGAFGPTRRLRYAFFEHGGYVAMAKRYREHARAGGLLKTLIEKRAVNPYVDRLVGAVNVWCWDSGAVEMCRELRAAGIERILWSHRRAPAVLRELDEMGVLTSRYDIYQDTMDPANFANLHGVHPDWTTAAWPDDLLIDADGRWQRGWRVRGKGDKFYPCGVLCDRQAVAYARRRIPPEIESHGYRSRFIDTTTASAWRECYSPDHPMTRSESRHSKMELLRFVSEGCGLVTGSETGHEAAVPYVHYFEGMLSLGPYRVPNAGRNMMQPVLEIPERVAKFQTGHRYRLPLWELVYHDCVVAQWYWGDYNNKLPALWDRRDLWNALYGAPPMFMFRRAMWRESRERFVRSYRTVAPVARATGYCEMLSHRWLTEDHAVQETRFAGGVTVIVNFGDQPWKKTPDGAVLPPLSHRVEGLDGALGSPDRSCDPSSRAVE